MDASYGLAFATRTRWDCLGKRLRTQSWERRSSRFGAVSHVPGPVALTVDYFAAFSAVRFCHGRSGCAFSVG
ncbi:hypothetical protein BDW71DRAFT_167687 [Aspergillus fruticulosus]